MDNNLQIEDKLEKYTIHIDSLNCNLQNNNTEIYVDLDNDIKNCIYFKTLKSEIFVKSSYKYNSKVDNDLIPYLNKGDEIFIDVNGIERIIMKEKKYVPIKANSLLQYGLKWERFFDKSSASITSFKVDSADSDNNIDLANNLRTNNWLENNILTVDSSLINNLTVGEMKTQYFNHPAVDKNKIYYKVKERLYTDKKILGTKWIKSNNKSTGKEFNNLKLLQKLHPGLNWVSLTTNIDTEVDFTPLSRQNTIKYFLANYDVLKWTEAQILPNLDNVISNKYIRHYLSNIDFLKWKKIKTVVERVGYEELKNSSTLKTNIFTDADHNIQNIKNIFESVPTYNIRNPPDIVKINIDNWINEDIRVDTLYYENNNDYLIWKKITTVEESNAFKELKKSGVFITNIFSDTRVPIQNIKNIFLQKITSNPDEVIIESNEWPNTDGISLDELYYENDADTIYISDITAYTSDVKIVQHNIDFNILYDTAKIDFDTINTNSCIRSNSIYYNINSKNAKTTLTLNDWRETGINNITDKNYVELNGKCYVPETQYYFTEKELQILGLNGKISKKDYIKFDDNTYYLPDYDNLGNTGYIYEGSRKEITTDDINESNNYKNYVLYNNIDTLGSARITDLNIIDYSQLFIDNIYITDKRYYDKIDITNDLSTSNYIFKNELTGTSCGPNDTNTVILNPILPEIKRFTIKLYKTNEFGEHEPITINNDGVYRVKVSFTIYYKRKKITRV
jgi:hypothetical protein